MPYVYTQDKNGRFRQTGSADESELLPVVGGSPPAKPAPKRKPQSNEKPWWWHLTPGGLSNDLRYEQRRLDQFNRQPAPRRTGAESQLQRFTSAVQRTNPVGMAYQALPAAGRQMVMGATVRALEDAGLAAVNLGQRIANLPKNLSTFGGARDPEATPIGRAILGAGRALRVANRTRLREEMRPEDDLIESIPANFAANAALAPLTAGAGSFIKGAGMLPKAGRWAVGLAADEGAANLITDNTMGGPSGLLKAAGVPVPDALSADPSRDDRISAAIRELPAAMAIAGGLGAGLGAGVKAGGAAAGTLGDNLRVRRALATLDRASLTEQAPYVARSLRENRMVQELRTARQKTVANGLQELDPATGLHTFTPVAKTEPPPVAAPRAAEAAPAEPATPAAPEPTQTPISAEPATAPAAKDLEAPEEVYDPELPEIDAPAVALERLDPDVIDQIAQTPGPVLPQIEQALANKPPVTPRPELDIAAITASADKLAQSEVMSRREEWANLSGDKLLAVFHPEVNPGMFNLIQSRTGRSFEELTRNDAIETLVYMEEQGATVIPDRLNAGLGFAQTADLVADPDRFQYKLNTDRRGVQKGNSLEGLGRWNTNMEGIMLVWEDPATGKSYVVNGHNRLAKAQELGIPTVPVKRLLASTAEQARALGALDNIASGGGTPWDAAKFFRDAKILNADKVKAAGLPLSSGHAQQGLELAGLPDNIFQAGLTGELPEARALALGASGLSPEKMQSVWSEYQGDKFFRSEDNFRQLIDLARDTPTTAADSGGRIKQQGIPGLETEADRDLTKVRIKLSKAIESNLSTNRRALKDASRNADILEAKGNSKIDAETSMQAGLDAEQLRRVFVTLRYLGGNEISAMLNAGAEEIAAGANLEAVARRIQGELAQAAEKVMLPKAPEPAAPEPAAPELPMPRTAADIEAAKLTILNRAAAGGEVRPSATPIPEPPKVKPGINLQDVVTSEDQLKLAQQQRAAALEAGDKAAADAWEQEARRIQRGRLAADQAARNTSQAGLFGETEYDTSLPLLQAEDQRLAAEYDARDAAMQAGVARAEREAAGYHDLTFEEKQAQFGITDGWSPPPVAPPAERAAPAASTAPSFVFPEEMAKSAPRYGMATLRFADDFDRAAYILRDASKKSKGEDRLIQSLEAQGFDIAEVRKHGKQVHATVKAAAKEQTGSVKAPLTAVDLTVPATSRAGVNADSNINRKFDQFTSLSSALKDADGGRLKGVSKRALQLAEEGDPDLALREATDYAQRRLAELDNELSATKQRAIQEGC